MLFTQQVFFIFLVIVFSLYWLIPKEKIRYRNILLLISSYVFYGWWDWRFLSLIFISSLCDYFLALKISSSAKENIKKRFLLMSLFINLGLLVTFKYFNFFIENAESLLTAIGFQSNLPSLKIILPVGISFYTFQTLSYTIDVYRGNLKPTNSVINFFAFVSFFPQLVAGPIERASHLLPQFSKTKKFCFDNFENGCRIALWGFFKKVVVADNCANIANQAFENYQTLSGLALFLGMIAFSFQIYGDFSGYSDIAIGVSRMFGFDLMRNFRSPYLARDIAEFWRRWHISLSTWFRDYLYIPLGGSRGGRWISIRNTFAIFLISGFWHGANWTFIFWGLIHALLFLPLLLQEKNRKNLSDDISIIHLPKIATTYILVCFAWVFFRAPSIQVALSFISRIFSKNLDIPFNPYLVLISTLSICTLIFSEYVSQKSESPLIHMKQKSSTTLRWCTYIILINATLLLQGKVQDFIYFQF